jgi:hypothetical protein
MSPWFAGTGSDHQNANRGRDLRARWGLGLLRWPGTRIAAAFAKFGGPVRLDPADLDARFAGPEYEQAT